VSEYPVKGRGTMGVKTAQLVEVRGRLAGARIVRDGYQVMLISDGGTVIRTAVDGIKRSGRATQGVIVMRLREGEKVSSLARGTVAVLLGAVFGVFALIFLLETAAWGLNAILIDGAGDLWIGFAIVFGVLALLTIVVFLFAWRKLRVGPPTPQMAIDEAKRIKETVATTTQDGS
jgi:hypothetical protein